MGLLLLLVLALLQAFVGEGLLVSLAAYGLIGIAALLSFILLRSDSRADRFCLCSTAIFCGYVILRALTSPVTYVARADLYFCLAALVLYGIAATMFTNSSARMSVIVSLLVLAMVHVWIGFIQFGSGENFKLMAWLEDLDIEHRASGLYLNPAHLAGLLEVLGALGLGITCWSRWPKSGRVITGYLTAACYVGLILTGSRGGYVSAFVSLLVFTFLSILVSRAGDLMLYRKIGIGSLIALAIVLAAGFSLISHNSSLDERFKKIAAIDTGRVDLRRAAIAQWRLQPLVGTGSGTYLYYGRQFRAETMQSDPVLVHNEYLQLLCEYGLVGLIAFGFFLAAHLHRGWQNFVRLGPRRVSADGSLLGNRLALTIGALSALAACAVHSTVDFNMHIPANALLVPFLFGLLANPGPRMDAETPAAPLDFIPRAAVALLGAILLIQCIRFLPGEYFAKCTRHAVEDERPSAAIACAYTAFKYEQRNPNIFFYLGRAHIARADQTSQGSAASLPAGVEEEYRAALAAFETARRLSPLEEAYPLDVAYIYDQLGRFAEAEWMYTVARSLDPRSHSIEQLYQAHLETWQNAGLKTPADTVR